MARTKAQVLASAPGKPKTTKRRLISSTQTDQPQSKKQCTTNSVPIDESSVSNECNNIIASYDPRLGHLDILTSEYSPTPNVTQQTKSKRIPRKRKRFISENSDVLLNESSTSSRNGEMAQKRNSSNTNVSNEHGSNDSISDIPSDNETLISPENDQSDEPTTKTYSVRRAKGPRAPRKRPPEQQELLEKLALKFSRDRATSRAKCLVEDCRSQLLTWRPSNLKRHLKMKHASHYDQLFKEKLNDEKKHEIEMFNSIQDAVELVTVNGMPFSIMNSSGMRGFINARSEQLQSSGFKLSLNRWNIVDEVSIVSKHIEDGLKAELKGKIIHLMVDIATNGTLSMLGVNASYSNNYEVKCPSLGIVKITERHNAVNLADMLYDILAKYDVPLDNVFSITTDNGKNVVNSAVVLDIVANCCDTNVNPIYAESTHDDYENDVELESLLNNNGIDYASILDDVVENVVRVNDKVVLINHINCSTHTLQLGIKDSLVESDAVAILNEAKEICIALRTQIVQIEFDKLKEDKILPPLENSTRWGSRYLMVCSIFHNVS